MSDLSSIIDKVRKLQALSKSSNVHEAATAAAAAERLIQEYRLEQAVLEIEGKAQAESCVEDKNPLFTYRQRRGAWQSRLLGGLTWLYDTCALAAYNAAQNRTEMRLIGRSDDILLTRTMFLFVSHEIDQLVKPMRHEPRSYVTSFRMGAVLGVLHKMYQTKLNAMTAAGSTAIVLSDRKGDALATLAALYPEHTMKQKASQRYSDEDGFKAGVRAGFRMDVGAAGKRLAEGS